MSDPVLHIKDSYYFELPKVLWPSTRSRVGDFPEVWITLDPDFQAWEFERLYDGLTKQGVSLPGKAQVKAEWQTWVHDNAANFAKPFDEFLEAKYAKEAEEFQAWREAKIAAAKETKDSAALAGAKQLQFDEFVTGSVSAGSPYITFASFRADKIWTNTIWRDIKSTAGDVSAYVAAQDQAAAGVVPWDSHKLASYNGQLSGKILIPQPFGKLRNLYQADSGFTISKFMIIELAVALILCVVFSWLGGRVKAGSAPRGKLWNLLEAFVVYIRDQIAEPAIGHHDAHAFVPLLCTLFFFILGCNLFGMLPWAGAPTGAFGVTFGLALVTFGTVVACGMVKLGGLGFVLNLIPPIAMGRPANPLVRGIVVISEIGLKFGILLIEILGLCIKHMVLSIRLLANMVAGHLVLLGVMGLAFGTQAAIQYTAPGVSGWQWALTATIAVVGSTLFSLLELLVAFLQAYIFTFLSALFIGAAIHHH